MATIVSSPHSAQPERLRSFVVPREHGAWGMLLIPLATGAGVGLVSHHSVVPLLMFVAASLAIFALRTPVEAWMGASALRPSTPEERRLVLYSIFTYAAIAALAVGWLLFVREAYGLIFIGLSSGIVFGLQATLKKMGREARLASQMVGAIGLTSTAAGAYYVVTNSLGPMASTLWALNWLFAANQIHYVQVRIRGARAATFREKVEHGKPFLFGEGATAILLAALCGTSLIPGPVALAFLPVLLRGFHWFVEGPKPLVIHRLGFTELAHALAFGVLLIFGFYL
jgi:hypothetical protein